MEEARQTPYELVFGQAGFETEHFPRILEEAEARGVHGADPDRFLMLATVGELLRELPAPLESRPEQGPWGQRASPVRQYGLLLFQGFNFWRFERELYLLEESLARVLVDEWTAVGEWELTAPAPAGYLQLPRHLFWAAVSETETPEAVDGLFWTAIGTEDVKIPPYARLDLLLVLGMRPGRPGFGVIGIDERLDALPTGHWADIDARAGSTDFASVLPGGELGGLYSLTTPGEALKLLSRCFYYVARNADALDPLDRPPPEPRAAAPQRLPPSALPYQRLHLTDADG